jgi:hypothetical protein
MLSWLVGGGDDDGDSESDDDYSEDGDDDEEDGFDNTGVVEDRMDEVVEAILPNEVWRDGSEPKQTTSILKKSTSVPYLLPPVAIT